MFSVRNLTLGVHNKNIFPVWNVAFALTERERVAVVGESGGGKTSLAWGLLGHPVPGQRFVSGSIRFRGTDLLSLAPVERARLYYRDMALVPQNAQHAFHPTRRLWQAAREIIAKRRPGKLTRSDIAESIAAMSDALELPAALWSHYPHQLSGGQKQRMALILALLNNPQLLVLDEPSNALDELNRQRLIHFLSDWASSRNTALLLFTHDMGIATGWAARVIVLYRGEIVEELPAAMLETPLHPYTRGLMDASIRLGDPPLSRRGIPGHTVPLSAPPQGCGFSGRCPVARDYCRKETPRLLPWGKARVKCFAVC